MPTCLSPLRSQPLSRRTGLSPFFSYYGSKQRDAGKYPDPRYDTIIEPFAGSAGYSLRYYDRKVILYEKNEIIFGVLDYLIHAPAYEIGRFPAWVEHVDHLPHWVPQEGRDLVGLWMNISNTGPRKTPSTRCREGKGWRAGIRDRIAAQMPFIRHWKVRLGSYEEAPNIKATWHIDPPYIDKGIHYPCSSEHIDYKALANWCRSRPGQVMVCEQEGADWLPFKPLHVVPAHSSRGKKATTAEVLWVKPDEYKPIRCANEEKSTGEASVFSIFG